MSKIISFALGNIWRWEPDRSDLIKYVKKLDVAGVEITLAYAEELRTFKLSPENKLWLRSLEYVSIHAPFFSTAPSAAATADTVRQLKLIQKLYRDTGAKNVVIHPGDLPSPELLAKFDFAVSTENLAPDHDFPRGALRKILDRYPSIGLCLDVSHSYLFDKYETGRLVRMFKNRISQFHFSGVYRGKTHQSLKNASRDFLFSLRPLADLDVPIVLEEDIAVKNLDYAKAEIECARNLLSTFKH